MVIAPLTIEIKYKKANSLIENGQYDEAIIAFTELENYKDSVNKIIEGKYLQANKLVDEKNIVRL